MRCSRIRQTSIGCVENKKCTFNDMLLGMRLSTIDCIDSALSSWPLRGFPFSCLWIFQAGVLEVPIFPTVMAWLSFITASSAVILLGNRIGRLISPWLIVFISTSLRIAWPFLDLTELCLRLWAQLIANCILNQLSSYQDFHIGLQG